MKKLDIIHNVIIAAFFLCTGAALTDVLLRQADKSHNSATCRLADEYQATLAREIRHCPTEMCVLYFQDRAAVAEEECSLETGVKAKPVELPVTEKY